MTGSIINAICIFTGMLIALLWVLPQLTGVVLVGGAGTAIALSGTVVLWDWLCCRAMQAISLGMLSRIWNIHSSRFIFMATSLNWLIVFSFLKITAWQFPGLLSISNGSSLCLLAFITALVAWLVFIAISGDVL